MELSSDHECLTRVRRRLGRSLLWLAMKTSPEINDQVNLDALTKLYSRDTFNEMYRNQITNNKRRRPEGASDWLVFIDVDKLKDINDNEGHAHGDEKLKAVANGIQRSIRQGDFAGRFGGDEFLVAFRDVIEIAPIKERMQQLNQQLLGNGISLSIGVVEAPRGSELDDLVVLADQLMYQVKQSGGNGILMTDSSGLKD